MVKIVKKEVKNGDYASTSEFFRHLIREWNAGKLAMELNKEKERFDNGEGKVLESLADLR